MDTDEEISDRAIRLANSTRAAVTVADDLRKTADWLVKYTGGTAQVDDTGFIDDLLDRYQQDNPEADLTDAVRQIVIVELLHQAKYAFDMIDRASLQFSLESGKRRSAE